MASSTDSPSNSHVKDSALESTPRDIHEVLLEIAQAMEGKSREEYQTLLHALKNPKTQSSPEKQTTGIATDNDTKPVPDGKEHTDKRSLESLNKMNDVTPNLEDSVSHHDGQNQNSLKDNKLATKEKNISMECDGQDVNGVGKEESKEEKRNSETCQMQGEQNGIKDVPKQNDEEAKADKRCLEGEGSNQSPDMKSKDENKENITIRNKLSLEYKTPSGVDKDVNKLKPSGFHRGKEHEEALVSSDDDMAPSTPASGGHSSGSDLSESSSENHTDDLPGRDSQSHIESKRPKPPKAPLQTTVTSYLPQATESLTRASLSNAFERTPPTSSSPTRTQEKTPLNTGSYRSPATQDPGESKVSTAATHLPPSTLDDGPVDLGLLYALPAAQCSVPKTSHDVMGNKQPGTSTRTPLGFQPPGSNVGFQSSIPASAQVSMNPITVSSSTSDTSTVMVKPQNSLSTINGLPSMPLYYQPHVVMQDQLPVLVLRPVVAPDSSSSTQLPSSDSKGGLPFMFPLVSSNGVKGDHRLVPSVSDDELADPFNKHESFPLEAELVSGYASSVTESELDEATMRKLPPRPYRDTARPPVHRSTYEKSYGQSSSKPYDWEFPSSNPFSGNYDTTPTTSVFSSSLQKTMSEGERSLYDKQGARSKNTQKTNPFAPDIPPRTDIEHLSRNDFKSIPKSMLASTDTALRPSDDQRRQERDTSKTHHRRLSSDSMITLIESECEPEETPMDITEAVARQENARNNSNQSRMFEPSVGPFFEEDKSSLTQHNSLPVVTPVTYPTSQPSPVVSISTSQPQAAATTREEPRKTRARMPGQVAPLWVPDDQISKCCSCKQRFTLIRRKHHCRGCGKIFCSTCCSQLARLSYLEYRIGRICVFCTNIIKEVVKAKKAQRSHNASGGTRKSSNTAKQTTSGGTPSSPPPYLPLSLSNSNVPRNPGITTQPVNAQGTSNMYQSIGSTSQPIYLPPQQLLVPSTPNFQPDTITYTDPMTGKVVKAPIVYQPQSTFPGQATVPGQHENTIFQNQLQGIRAQPGGPPSQHMEAQSASTASPSSPKKSEAARKVDPKDLKLPLRPAGRIISWKGGQFCSRLMLQERRKALIRDLKELPNGVTIQVADELQVIVKKIKVQRPSVSPYLAWCFCSNGLSTLCQTEIVMLFEVKPKEDMFPEEVLRIYKVILDLVKLGNSFKHGNFIAFNSPFLGSTENAAFLFADDSFTNKLRAIYENKNKVLYGILVKRQELEITKHMPIRFLLRLGQESKNFPFPVVNARDRAVVYDGIDVEDKFYHTSCAMNAYLKNIVPEALIPGLVILKEDAKIVFQIPLTSQTAVVSLFDRLVVKAYQTATIPLASDLSPEIHEYKVFHQSVVTKEMSFAKSISLFRNPGIRRQSYPTVTGLGFLILHLGASSTAVMNHGGEVFDDGAVVYLSKFHTQKLLQSLYEHSNCYFYLGDRFEIVHFELRWLRDRRQPEAPKPKAPSNTYTPETKEEFPGTATIDIRHSGHTPEMKKLASAGVGDALILIRSIEDRIKRVCMEPLMAQANKMRAGEARELILRVSLKQGIKKWSIGPSNQPMGLIRSLQMALHAVALTELHDACLELTFDITITKQ